MEVIVYGEEPSLRADVNRLKETNKELLEACENVLRFMGKDGWEWSAENQERKDLPWARMQTAIKNAKAEGR